jgi:putative tryptophan/tyrosine transport system substrate-binding protein
MRRREFIGLVGGAAAAWPLAARAQQAAMPVIGYLFSGSDAATDLTGFRKGLSEMGFVEGRNVTIESRIAEDQYDRLPVLAAELVHRNVAVIYVGGGSNAALAAKAATTTIPIVFTIGGDPVASGIVASFNRPEGNVTGVSFRNGQLTAKRFGLMHQMVPTATRFAVLVDPAYLRADPSVIPDARAAAASISGQIDVVSASTEEEIDTAFASLVDKRAEALLIAPGPLFSSRRAQLATLAARNALPTIHFDRRFVEVGGLMSYGSSIADANRQAGIYVGRILKGEKPTDLPIVQPNKLELVINLATAKALGIEVAPTLLAIADEVIE